MVKMKGSLIMKLGVQVFTVRDFFKDINECRESYKKIVDIGYTCVQTWPPPYLTAVELKEMLDEFGLVNCSSGGSFEQMKADEKAITNAIAGARIFDTPYIAIGTLPDEYRYTKDGLKQYASELNNIGKVLKKENCSLIYHHHALEFYSFGGGVNGMDILVNETDPESVLFTLDTHWLVSGGVNPVEWIYKLKGRVPIIHFKDYGIGSGAGTAIEGVDKTYAEVGEGNINWIPVIEACRETKVEFIIVEQDICQRNPFDSIRLSYDNLKKFNL